MIEMSHLLFFYSHFWIPAFASDYYVTIFWIYSMFKEEKKTHSNLKGGGWITSQTRLHSSRPFASSTEDVQNYFRTFASNSLKEALSFYVHKVGRMREYCTGHISATKKFKY